MKGWIALLLASMLALWQAPAQSQARAYSQAELDALLAPVALYPDSVLSHILVAATRPDDLRQAAAWSRANPQLAGDEAVRAAEPIPWHPSVKALLAFPDLLARMDESPQWTADLGTAFLEQEPYVMDTVQALRRRAQASGALESNDYYSVQQHGSSIAVYPVHPHIVYVPYYNPYVVYGPWWWPSYRPVYWRPWHPRPAVHLSRHFFAAKVDWHRRHVMRHDVRAAPVTIHNHAHPVRPIIQGARIDAARPAHPRPHSRREHREHRVERLPDTPGIFHKQVHTARPIAQSMPQALPAPRAEPRRDLRPPQPHAEPVQRHHSPPRDTQRHGDGHRGRNAQQRR
jgi:hypothetical protein